MRYTIMKISRLGVAVIFFSIAARFQRFFKDIQTDTFHDQQQENMR
jgi:hypothetical protein